MEFRELQTKLDSLHTFTLQDVENAFGSVDRAQLSRWATKGQITRVYEGFYTLHREKIDIHLLANELRPSYISLEYALSYYNIIPETVHMVTGITSMPACSIETAFGNLLYKKIKPELFTGYVLKPSIFGDVSFRIATPEKALFDLVYVRKDLGDEADYESMRFNIPEGFDTALLSSFFRFVDSGIRKKECINF